MKPFYITTSIPYPNANPHIGHALEFVQADFLARYYRLKGEEVFFLTGIDVHGLKIQRTAEKAGISSEVFIDQKAEVFRQFVAELYISADRFIQTNDPDHMETAQALWAMCERKGDIYKKRYQAWYNVKEEEFLGLVEDNPDASVFGIDPQFIEKIDEENYFFALSRYTNAVVKLLESGTYKVVPDYRLLELLNFVKQKGLQDVSISREKSKLSWGVPVPGDPDQVMYVWYDALTNYLTPVSKVDGGSITTDSRWPASLHCIGKDISRFHALLWTGMLLSAGIAIPQELLIHGFITSGGQKMSKSIGNVVDPFEAVSMYGADPVRWYLLKEVPTTGDADFTFARMDQVYSADLANDLGNLVSRVWTMCSKYTDGKVPNGGGKNTYQSLISKAWENYEQAIEAREIHQALATTHTLLVYSNRRIDEAKPWVLAKDEAKREELEGLLYELLEIIREVTCMLTPAIPHTTERIGREMLAVESLEVPLTTGQALGTDPVILFPRRNS